MLSELLYLAISLYYQNRNSLLGLELLLGRTDASALPPDFLDWWDRHRVEFRQKCEYFSRRGIQFTYPGCWDYPAFFLKRLEQPPLFLTYRGHPAWNQQLHLAVVGSRKMAPSSQQWIQSELFQFLEGHPVSLISGGARGVDQCAHFCSLRARRPTFVFLPSGLESLYPRELKDWMDPVLEGGGAFLSEYWPETEIRKYYFVERNRLITSFSDYTLIIQGEQRSGTMLTAKWALDLGRNLLVVPGHPTDAAFSGNSELVRIGVPPVMDSQDLAAALTKG